MMRLSFLVPGVLVAILAGCATTPRTISSEVAFILWLRPVAGCDFERPDRDDAKAISTSRTEAAIVDRRTAASVTYVVRDAQLMARPNGGEHFCLALLRGPTLGRKDAVFGFDAHFLDAGAVELTPAYTRLGRSANGATRSTAVRIAFGSGRVSGGTVQPVGDVEFDLGTVDSSGGRQTRAGAGVLSLPTPGQGGLTRLVAVVEEASPGAASSISRSLIEDTLNQVDRWD